MEAGKKANADPTAFASSLHLDNSVQQVCVLTGPIVELSAKCRAVSDSKISVSLYAWEMLQLCLFCLYDFVLRNLSLRSLIAMTTVTLLLFFYKPALHTHG